MVEHILHFLEDFAKHIIYQGVHMVINAQVSSSISIILLPPLVIVFNLNINIACKSVIPCVCVYVCVCMNVCMFRVNQVAKPLFSWIRRRWPVCVRRESTTSL